jgi:hypothetical protein
MSHQPFKIEDLFTPDGKAKHEPDFYFTKIGYLHSDISNIIDANIGKSQYSYDSDIVRMYYAEEFGYSTCEHYPPIHLYIKS